MEWLFFAILGVGLGAIVHIVDTLFRKGHIFDYAIEPAVISGLFQSMAWFSLPFIEFSQFPSKEVIFFAFGGGIFHFLSLWLYFKAIFHFGDISLISLLWNLLAATVPLLAFFFIGERLSWVEYTGIATIFFGAMVISYSNHDFSKSSFSLFGIMVSAVFFMAISMVLIKEVFTRTDYWSGYFLYNFGIVGSALVTYLFFLCQRKLVSFHHRVRKFFFVFLLMEFLQLAGEFCSNLAINRGPVSLVAAIESLQPAMILLMIGILFLFVTRFYRTSKKFILIFSDVLTTSFQNIFLKTIALMSMCFGIFLVTS